jgi:hypothetical protein
MYYNEEIGIEDLAQALMQVLSIQRAMFIPADKTRYLNIILRKTS